MNQSSSQSKIFLTRRRFLQTAAASLGAASPAAHVLAQDACHSPIKQCTTVVCKQPPNFSLKGARLLAGVRPYRRGSYRLEWKEVQGKYIVHNYGHGGAGITMSLGCAEQVVVYVREIIQEHAHAASDGIAVLGGGVMGLTAATALAKAYFPATKIEIYTKDTYRRTTSHKAGGQWSPASVAWDRDDEKARKAFADLLASSLRQFTALLGAAYGISSRTNYALSDDGGLEIAHDLGLIDKKSMDRLPFANMNCSGYAYDTLLVEPPIFLKRLHNDLVKKLGTAAFHPTTFPKAEAGEPMSRGIANLKQKIIVNCTGLGASELFGDENAMEPIKGHLILLPPQKLDYLFSGYSCHDWVQYVFPRRDGVIVGGTYQSGRSDERENEKIGIAMASTLKRLFEGKLAPECNHDIPLASSLEQEVS